MNRRSTLTDRRRHRFQRALLLGAALLCLAPIAVATRGDRTWDRAPTLADTVAAQSEHRLYLPYAQRSSDARWDPAAHVGGRVTDVATDDGYAYVGVGSRLVAYDLEAPAGPAVIGASDVAGGAIRPMAFQDGFVVAVKNSMAANVDDLLFGDGQIIPDASSGLAVFDVGDPAAPRLVGQLATTGWAQHLAARSGVAFVVDFQGLLHVVDLADPSFPMLLSTLRLPQPATSIAVSDTHAFVGGLVGSDATSPDPLEPRLLVVDVSDLYAPRLAAALATDRAVAGSLAIAGDHVFLSTGDIVDVSEPAQPAVVGSLEWPSDTHQPYLVVRGDTLYAAASAIEPGGSHRSAVRMYDVGDPTRPVLEAESDLADRTYSLTAGPAGVLVRGVRSLHQLSANDLVHVASVEASPFSAAGAVAVQGDVAYVTSVDSLTTLDVTDPTGPLPTGSLALGDTQYVFFRRLVVDGDRAYALASEDLSIVDVSNPAAPRLLSAVRAEARMQSLAVVGSTVYVAETPVRERTGRLRVFDASDPAVPRELDGLGGTSAGVFVGGDLLFRSTDCQYGAPPDEALRPCFQVVDISEPTRPRPLGSALLSEPAFYDGQLVGQNAVVATDRSLLVFDVSEATRPREVAGYQYKGASYPLRAQLDVADGRAWVVGLHGVEVVDISDPLQPIHVASPNLLSGTGIPYAYNVALGRAAYVGGDGLWVFDLDGP